LEQSSYIFSTADDFMTNPQVASRARPIRERIGLGIDGSNSAAAVKSIVAAEDAGVRQIWMAQIPILPDTLTTLAAAAEKTSTINLGTSIVPTYPRHPLVMTQQALAIHDLAPGRFRLGIGPSHRFIVEDMYGLQHIKPLAHLREYIEVLRAALWDGKVNHHDEFFNIEAMFPRTAQVPIFMSTLGKKAFQLAGQIADGALTWVCPVPYIINIGIPALRSSASEAGRSAPILVAHVPVALSEDRDSVLSAGHRILDFYAKIPFYANMFSSAGFQITSNQSVPDALVDTLLVSGNEATVSTRLRELLGVGLNELLVTLAPVSDTAEDEQQARLMHLIGQL
jgi:F420-dependent oxidoreductase-like protein